MVSQDSRSSEEKESSFVEDEMNRIPPDSQPNEMLADIDVSDPR